MITQIPDTQNNSTFPIEEDTTTNFPVYEIVDLSISATKPAIKSSTVSLIIRQFSRNVGPPKFYDQRFFTDVVDLPQATSGLASNPIILENCDIDKRDHINSKISLEVVAIDSESSTPNQICSSSTDKSLRMAIDNFEEKLELDSELFIIELENVLNYKI